MKTMSVFILLVLCSAVLAAQEGIARVLAQIEQNNLTLKALAQQRDADKAGAAIGLFPDGPEIGWGWLSGDPSRLGKRTDFGVRQTFDPPPAYLYRARLARARRGQSEWKWRRERRALLLDARLLCLDLIGANARQKELERQLERARELAGAIRTRLLRGDASAMELNRAELGLLTIGKKAEDNGIERDALQAELCRLNGGIPLELADDRFPAAEIPDDFPSWVSEAERNNPDLHWLSGEADLLRTQAKLERSLWLPRLTFGFMSETINGERYAGLTAGLTFSLPEQKSRAGYARKSAEAAGSMERGVRRQFLAEMKGLHARARALQRSVSDFRERLSRLDVAPLLEKALAHGEISVLDYILELQMIADSREQLLQMECDLARTTARLLQYSS